ncbi:hypothetical protein Vadar_005175 [Vaccinium darrowii]|uniref:Uncharacterized protein n=1 Tax=Vaccinium darrowii TaxID=229202 RepID=A0ACB7XGM0_9ERIC|nr:hypothetical protein Vadar_005175 [Vaccinium darrowii]
MSESEDLGKELYEACVSGSVPALDSLIEKDKLILNRVNSLTCFFSETPLHVAVLCGHLDFTKALLTRKPELVTEFDTRGCSPLHLASTEGHVEIVRELLRVDNNVCIARDLEGRIPLHLAAMKGRVEVIRKLLRAKPESIHEKLGKGETVLHLCVKYYRLEALETLFQYLQSCSNMEFLLNSEDDDGNTILHLAVGLKQMETIKYLLGKQIIKDHANVKNKNGSSALDVVEHWRNRDLKTIEIHDLLVQAGRHDDNDPPPRPQGRCKVLGEIMKWISWFWMRYLDIDHGWLKEVRGHLITAATLTATMAYQALLSPPGGVWQDASKDDQASPPLPYNNDSEPQHEAGDAILDSYGPASQETKYVVINTVVLVASLSTIILALSGFPLQNKFLLWVLIFTMYTTISFLAIAYFMVLDFVFPSLDDKIFNRLRYLLIIWFGIMGLVVMLHACHFFVWLRNKFGNLVTRCRTRGGANHITHEKSSCWQP